MSSLQQHTADLFGLDLSAEQVAAFDALAEELIEWNEFMNLTAITEPGAIRVRHFLDSFSLVRVVAFQPGMSMIDVGTGAGFPGLPLAILYPQVQVTLLESTGKKVRFLNHVIEQLNLKNARAIQMRAEDAGQQREHREAYDVVVARALARMPVLMEYLLPLARLGGQVIAMKGITAAEETATAQNALRTLGGTHKQTIELQLPDVENPHYLVTFAKTGITPGEYPRQAGTPSRQPL